MGEDEAADFFFGDVEVFEGFVYDVGDREDGTLEDFVVAFFVELAVRAEKAASDASGHDLEEFGIKESDELLLVVRGLDVLDEKGFDFAADSFLEFGVVEEAGGTLQQSLG